MNNVNERCIVSQAKPSPCLHDQTHMLNSDFLDSRSRREGGAHLQMLSAIKAELAHRRRRYKHLPAGCLGEPAWEMMLDLMINALEGRLVSTSSLCLASNAPQTTALRYIEYLERKGLIRRGPKPEDGRVRLVQLTDEGVSAVAACYPAEQLQAKQGCAGKAAH